MTLTKELDFLTPSSRLCLRRQGPLSKFPADAPRLLTPASPRLAHCAPPIQPFPHVPTLSRPPAYEEERLPTYFEVQQDPRPPYREHPHIRLHLRFDNVFVLLHSNDRVIIIVDRIRRLLTLRTVRPQQIVNSIHDLERALHNVPTNDGFEFFISVSYRGRVFIGNGRPIPR